MTGPHWLPSMLTLSGSPTEDIEWLFQIFRTDFIDHQCQFRGMSIDWDRRKHDGLAFDEGFWHIISRLDQIVGDRKFEPRRARRLPWCAPVIQHDTDATVKVWEQAHNGRRSRIRTYIWLEQHDYVIVLERKETHRGSVMFLVTAYCVDGQSTRRKLQRGYRRGLT